MKHPYKRPMEFIKWGAKKNPRDDSLYVMGLVGGLQISFF
jgi:hypothetical protein